MSILSEILASLRSMPGSGILDSNDISDATDTGKKVLTAESEEAVKDLIKAKDKDWVPSIEDINGLQETLDLIKNSISSIQLPEQATTEELVTGENTESKTISPKSFKETVGLLTPDPKWTMGDSEDGLGFFENGKLFATLHKDGTITVPATDTVDTTIPTQPVETAKMLIGMNMPWIAEWSGALLFANLMHGSAIHSISKGTGNVTNNFHGIFRTDDKENTVMRLSFINRTGLINGTYTVRNPSKIPVCLAGWGVPQDSEFKTDESWTYEVTDKTTMLFLHVKGDLENTNGNLEIIIPGHVESYDSGNIWNTDFINFCKNLNLKTLRMMDMLVASENAEETWSQRTLPSDQSFVNQWGLQVIPWECVCDLANRVDADPWINIPYRVDDNYVENLANVFKEHLPTGKKVWLELGNEIWNWGAAWAGGSWWLNTYDYTRVTGQVDSNTLKVASHGLQNGAHLQCFPSVKNALVKGLDWRLSVTGGVYAKAIDIDTLELYTEKELVNKLNLPLGTKEIIYVNLEEPGKVLDINGNYGKVSLRFWGIFDGVLGRDKSIHLIAAQAGNSSTTRNRLAYPGVLEAVDYVAIAPYFEGIWGGGKLTNTATGIIASWWSNRNLQLSVSIYPKGTLNITDINAWNGLGSVAHTIVDYTSGSSNFFDIQEMVLPKNDYDVYFTYQYQDVLFKLNGTINQNDTSVFVSDSFDNQFLRNRLSTIANRDVYVLNTKNEARGVPLVCYEGGLHFHESAPEEVKNWLKSYQESETFGKAIAYNLATNSASDVKLFNYYSSVLGTVFSIANSMRDTNDERYKAFLLLQGKVNADVINAGSLMIDNIQATPTSYPYTVHEFENKDLSYNIIAGNDNNFYSMVDNRLILNSTNNYQFNTPELRALKIEATAKDGNSEFFNIKFFTGYSWYDPDAIYVFDSTINNDSSVMTPTIGKPINPTDYKRATIENGWWKVEDTMYRAAGTGAMLSNFKFSKPGLIAIELSRLVNDAGFYIGASNNFHLNDKGIGIQVDSVVQEFKYSYAINVPMILWIYFDGQGNMFHGKDLEVIGTMSNAYTSNQEINGKYMNYSRGWPGSITYGLVQVINKDRFFIDDAIKVITKMKTFRQ